MHPSVAGRRILAIVVTIVVAAGCGGQGAGLSDTQRTYCDQWFGNVVYSAQKLNVLPTDIQLPPEFSDWNQVATLAGVASGGFSPYAQQLDEVKQAWQATHADTYSRACQQAHADYAPKQ